MPETRVLFLNPPSYLRFDVAGARFAAKRKAKTMWYPSWLSYAAGVVEEKGFKAKLIDSPAEDLSADSVLKIASEFSPELLVVNTSTPTLLNDIRVCEEIYERLNGEVKIVLTGPHVSVLPEETLRCSEAIWGVARKECEYTVLELAEAIEIGEDNYGQILGLSWKKNGKIIHNPDRPLVQNLDKLPFVTKVYKRHLDIFKYYLPFALYPYVSIYSARGCPWKCTFCLWPQTISGHKFRSRTLENVVEEMKFVSAELPSVKEIFFDDDIFTVDRRRVHKLCRLIKSEGIDLPWSVNVRADVDMSTLVKMKDAGCRMLLVGYESGDQGILDDVRKGITIAQMERFTRNAKRVGLMIHGTFIIGLPGENRKTIQKTINFAKRLNLDTVQFSVATPFPGTEFYNWCLKSGYIKNNDFSSWVDERGYQSCVIEYPDLSAEEIVSMVDYATRSFYFRLRYFLTLLRQMMKDYKEIPRILLSGSSFLMYTAERCLRRKRRMKECA